MIGTYTIKDAFPWQKNTNQHFAELEISSDNLLYTELGSTHSGVQFNGNNKLIHEKCKQIADLIREIDMLNKV